MSTMTRIIPARAGFTTRHSFGWIVRLGSSPLARGLPRWPLGSGGSPRIIPARAGFTPGVCGPGALRRGSSPLARGLRDETTGTVGVGRIIPARAGFTRPRTATGRGDPDHPRSRGVYTITTPGGYQPGGSSPLARGLRGRGRPDGGDEGIIPARAGFTAGSRARARRRSDHPRSRGVYSSASQSMHHMTGSSPLARGLRRDVSLETERDRIIPARAGFTSRPGAGSHGARDHPRSRGVYRPLASGPPRCGGSSPLARGLRHPLGGGARGPRIIPARAGFTAPSPPPAAPAGDHPRSRGVYLNRTSSEPMRRGSSPLARGLLRAK